jgi:hypothetical protein
VLGLLAELAEAPDSRRSWNYQLLFVRVAENDLRVMAAQQRRISKRR